MVDDAAIDRRPLHAYAVHDGEAETWVAARDQAEAVALVQCDVCGDAVPCTVRRLDRRALRRTWVHGLDGSPDETLRDALRALRKRDAAPCLIASDGEW